jgi:hypothetical protein
MVGWLLGFLTYFLLPNYLIVDKEAFTLICLCLSLDFARNERNFDFLI